MKTFAALAFITALFAFVFLPVNFIVAASVLFGAGLTTIMISDYSRVYRPLRPMPARVRVETSQHERFRLAA
jgi:hypothetical protein